MNRTTYALGMLVAVAVHASCAAQDPKDRAGWAKQIEAALEAERDKDALSLIVSAAKALPLDSSFQSASRWFKQHGDQRVKDKGFEAGLAVVDRALKAIPEKDAEPILRWRSNLFRLWSQSLLDKNDTAASLKVLQRALALDPTDGGLLAGISYHAQESLKLAQRKSVAAVLEDFQALEKAFPKVDAVARVGRLHAIRAVSKLADENKFQEALKAVDAYKTLLPKPEQRGEATAIVYDGWARQLSDKKDWQGALDKYAEGIKAAPDQARLSENAIATVDTWAAISINAKDWNAAIRVYDVGLKYFPDSQHLQTNRRFCVRMKDKGK